MEKKSKKDNEFDRISDEFDQIQDNQLERYDISNHLANMKDLPDLGQIELYDYDADLVVSNQNATEVVESLVDLYLGEFKDLKNHPYLINKMKEDISVYAESLFLSKMTRKNYLTQLRQVDNGDNSARIHEVINQTIREIRENIKFTSTQRTELEKYYKEFRNDIMEVSPKMSESDDSTGNNITDSKHLNDLITDALRKKNND